MKPFFVIASLRRLLEASWLFTWTEFIALLQVILIHGTQKRKYTYEPYWFHLYDVSMIIKQRGYPVEMVVAALYHDSAEDPCFTLPDRFGYLKGIISGLPALDHELVLDLVSDLTDVYVYQHFPHLNRKDRKLLEIKRFSSASLQAKIIKLADLYNNTVCIHKQDPGFYRVYYPECNQLLECIGNVDPVIFHQVRHSLIPPPEVLVPVEG